MSWLHSRNTWIKLVIYIKSQYQASRNRVDLETQTNQAPFWLLESSNKPCKRELKPLHFLRLPFRFCTNGLDRGVGSRTIAPSFVPLHLQMVKVLLQSNQRHTGMYSQWLLTCNVVFNFLKPFLPEASKRSNSRTWTDQQTGRIVFLRQAKRLSSGERKKSIQNQQNMTVVYSLVIQTILEQQYHKLRLLLHVMFHNSYSDKPAFTCSSY